MNYRSPFVNLNGLAILDSTSVSVGSENVTFTLTEPYNRLVPSRGLVLVNITTEIPSGTTDTLPIVFSMQGFTQNVTTYAGANLTVADMQGTGYYLLFYDRIRNILLLLTV